MDAAPLPSTPSAPAPSIADLKLLTVLPTPTTVIQAVPNFTSTARPPDLLAAWPRCAQLAGAFLIGALTTLLGIHALAYLRFGAEPSELEEASKITYRVDLNEARRAELLQLPGIGPSLADRIEEYRRVAGGFRSVNDLSKVKGIGPATLERVRPFVGVKSSDKPAPSDSSASQSSKGTPNKLANFTEPIDVNHASLTELQKLPGIGPKISQRIVDEREKRLFTSVSELRRVPGIGPKTLEKLKPYVTAKQ
jgi:competence protein ComEA